MAVGGVTLALMILSFFLKDFLLALILAMGGGLLLIYGNRPPIDVTFALTPKGLRIRDDLYLYAHLLSFSLRERTLLVRSGKILATRLHLPLPPELTDEVVKEYLAERLPESEEPDTLLEVLAEYIGL